MWTNGRRHAGSGLATLIVFALILSGSSPEVRAGDEDYWFAFPDQPIDLTLSLWLEITAENDASPQGRIFVTWDM